MGTDNIFKKRQAERKKRNHDIRKPKANSFLIVTEGKETEPNYFEGIQKLIQEKLGGTVNIVGAPQIDIEGKGCSTCALVRATEQIISKSHIMYQYIWIVFDKDDFGDFDEAIKLAKEKGYHVAWSNQSFEYWLYLHFYYCDSALHRSEWEEKMNDIFKEWNIADGKYKKNYPNLFELVNTYGDMETAIRNAKRRMSEYNSEIMKPSEFDPGTTVHELVTQLKTYLDE